MLRHVADDVHHELNNHTIAAFSVLFAIYPCVPIWFEGRRDGWRFAVAGFFAAWTACNELPAATFGVGLFVLLLVQNPWRTLCFFVPAALLPITAFLVTNWIAVGSIVPVQASFGSEWYLYEGSHWLNIQLKPTGIDAADDPLPVYVFHLLFGHHGFFSLSPIFLLALIGIVRMLVSKHRCWRILAGLTLVLSCACVRLLSDQIEQLRRLDERPALVLLANPTVVARHATRRRLARRSVLGPMPRLSSVRLLRAQRRLPGLEPLASPFPLQSAGIPQRNPVLITGERGCVAPDQGVSAPRESNTSAPTYRIAGYHMENLFTGFLSGVGEALGGVFLVAFLLLSLCIAYVVLRLREGQRKIHDPQLGTKVVLQFFFSASLLLGLTGAAILVGNLLQEDVESWNPAQRTATALILVGVAFALLHGAMLRRGTNNRDWPAAARFFTGWRFAIHGFVVITASAWLLALLLQSDPKAIEARTLLAERERYLFGTLLIWGPSWLLHLGLLWWYSTRPLAPTDVSWEPKE